MKWLNTYWVPVLLNTIACLFLIGVFGSFLPTNLVELQTTADYTTAMMIVGFVMWGVWNGIKVMLFVIDFCKGSEKDRMWIREMTEIGLNHQHTIQDVEMCNDKNCMYGKIFVAVYIWTKAEEISNCNIGKRTGGICREKSRNGLLL